MTDSSKQNLIGYLIHALDDDESKTVADDLRCDNQLRSTCQTLKCSLDLLAADEEPHEPPPHLAERTCDSIWALVDAPPIKPTEIPLDSSRERLVHPDYMLPDSMTSETAESYHINAAANAASPDPIPSLEAALSHKIPGQNIPGQNIPVATAVDAASPSDSLGITANSGRGNLGGGSLSSGNSGRTTWRWRPIEFVVAGCIVVVLGAIALPTIQHQRELSRRAYCQNNLRELGTSLAKYTETNNGILPSATETGPLAVAGSYAPQLRTVGLLSEPNLVLCPSAAIPSMGTSAASQTSSCQSSPCGANSGFQVPNVEQLQKMVGEELARMQRTMGGSYSYTLGHRENGQYKPLKNLQRPGFAVMGDLPNDDDKIDGRKNRSSHNATGHSTTGHHGAVGQNVLFEDGHYEFMIDCENETQHDHIYLNDAGRDAAGLHLHDAVMVESGKGPGTR